MRNASTPTPRDPEFDPVPSHSPGPPQHLARYYQILIVNPFLAMIGGACGWGVIAYLDGKVSHSNLLLVALPLVLIFFVLIQYHCVDCGATGLFFGRERHQCSRIRDRWHERRMSPPYVPRASAQLALWALAIGVGTLVFLTSIHRR